MAHKQAVLADADQAYGELTEAVGGLSDSELTQVFLGVWGTREILIHVAAWDREMAVALHRVGRGEAPHPDGRHPRRGGPGASGHHGRRRGAPGLALRPGAAGSGDIRGFDDPALSRA